MVFSTVLAVLSSASYNEDRGADYRMVSYVKAILKQMLIETSWVAKTLTHKEAV